MGSTAANDIPLGTILGGTYEISGVLGRGGMGTVFLARHLRLPGKQVAIKVLRHDGSLGKEVYLRFRREAEIATRLGHPNIVEVLDFNALEDGAPFLVMEHLRGMPLSRRMRKGPRLTLQEVFSIARQMGSALQAAHQAGVVHRDLKPGNVFLVPTEVAGLNVEHVKLLDFGISKIIDSKTVQTQDAILLGTPQYMAPEQALGKNTEVDPRTDIFCFGVLVYEMLARKLPFKDGGVLSELVYRIVYDPPEPLLEAAPDTPPYVVEAIEKALAKRPESRFAQVGDFVAALTGSPLRSATPASDAPITAPVPSAQVSTASVQPRPIASRLSKPPTVAVRRPASQQAPAPAVASPVAASAPLSGHSARVVQGRDGGSHAVGASVNPAPAALMPVDAAVSPAPQAVAPPSNPPVPEVDLDDEDAASEAATIQSATPPVGARRVLAGRWGLVALVAAVLLLAGVVALRVGRQSEVLDVAPLPRSGAPVTTVVPVAPEAPGQKPDVAPAEQAQGKPLGNAGPPGTVGVEPERTGLPAEPPGAEGTSPEVKPATGGDDAPVAEGLAPPSALPAESPTAAPKPPRPSAREDFAAADRALSKGDGEQALVLILRGQESSRSPGSFVLLTRAHCLRKDAAGAHEAWARVPASERARVRKFCQLHDISL
ncbi:protein kinase [Myxococcus sp. K15C18031901]|uniref:serine/threonine-protein kinase n=1 Tax=Myxococcus dinghuensis TaxID=2906761 RepID=UPI0020A8286A|nr:serine/threonine protein kinase [Myxococcus dinghuensis]MCP3105441.1 protein kinase [Myxococcus dinghuensis]